LDGTETLKRLQEHPTCADVPVIFMTAKVQRHEVNSYRALGALDVIPKPFDPMTLAATVENLWNENRAE
jgi:CheY-like chemotaxis protein